MATRGSLPRTLAEPPGNSGPGGEAGRCGSRAPFAGRAGEQISWTGSGACWAISTCKYVCAIAPGLQTPPYRAGNLHSAQSTNGVAPITIPAPSRQPPLAVRHTIPPPLHDQGNRGKAAWIWLSRPRGGPMSMSAGLRVWVAGGSPTPGWHVARPVQEGLTAPSSQTALTGRKQGMGVKESGL